MPASLFLCMCRLDGGKSEIDCSMYKYNNNYTYIYIVCHIYIHML